MKKSLLTTLALAVLLASAALNTHAEGGETYRQSGFTPDDVAVHPDGSVAYAAGSYQAPGTRDATPMLRRDDARGSHWNTLVLPAGAGRIKNVTVALTGRVYASGTKQLPEGSRLSRVWFSDDLGVTWSETADFLVSGQGIGDIATDAAGNIYMATSRRVESASLYATRHLTTYKGVPDGSAPTGVAWTLVDEYQPSSQAHFPKSIAIRPSGDAFHCAEIWVASNVIDAQEVNHLAPVLRRSVNGGTNWTTAAAWPVPSGYSIYSVGSVTVDCKGNAFVSATYLRQAGEAHCLIYRSTDGGGRWTLVDDVSGYYGENGAASDLSNGVFITGRGLTRASVDSGQTWKTVTDVTGGSCVTADLAGNLFAGGLITSGSATESCIYKLAAVAP